MRRFAQRSGGVAAPSRCAPPARHGCPSAAAKHGHFAQRRRVYKTPITTHSLPVPPSRPQARFQHARGRCGGRRLDQARRAVAGALAPSIADGGASWIQTNHAAQKNSTRTTSAPSRSRPARCWRAATTSPAPHDVAPAKTTKLDNGIQSKTAPAVFLRPFAIKHPRKNAVHTARKVIYASNNCLTHSSTPSVLHARARVGSQRRKKIAVQFYHTY